MKGIKTRLYMRKIRKAIVNEKRMIIYNQLIFGHTIGIPTQPAHLL